MTYKGDRYDCLSVEDLGLSATEKASVDAEMSKDAAARLKYLSI